jgi:threonine dehydrogenase-like Zn-dependent dehydrogenase
MTGRGLVVDVGGTTTRLSAHRDGVLTGTTVRFPTPSPRTGPGTDTDRLRTALFDRIADHVLRLDAQEPGLAEDIGVSFGAVVTRDGIVQDASVLWLEPSRGFDVVHALTARLPGARLRVLNDVAAAAWHYRHLGRFVLATVSTGVAFKVFDAGLPTEQRVLAGPETTGGESGHTVLDPGLVERLPPDLLLAAAAADPGARACLERLGVPWCECGAVGDLCSYASGPAMTRIAGMEARRHPGEFQDSALGRAVAGDPARIDAAALGRAAATGDDFTTAVLHRGTRPLAARLLQLCADLGLRRAVVVGGFAHGVGQPWFTALRRDLAELTVPAGWFRDWTTADRDALLHVPDDAEVAPLAGMAAYVHARRQETRTVVKPVNEHRLTLRTSERPVCGAEHLLLRTRYAGICGTDLQILRGERSCEPGVPGHECVAEVVEVGRDIEEVKEGDLVTVNPNNPRDDDDKVGHNRPGVFGELLRFDAGLVRRGQIVPLAAGAGPEAVLIEPLAAVVRAYDLIASVRPPDSALVVGAGTAGLLHALLLRRQGVRLVLLATRSARARRQAEALGICPASRILALDERLPDAVLRSTGGRGVDAAVVAVGGGAGPAVAGTVWPTLADGAVLHLFGGFPAGCALPVQGGDGVPVSDIRAAARLKEVTAPTGRRAVITGSRGGRPADFRTATALGEERGPSALAPGRLITHTVSLEAVPDAAAELAATRTLGGTPGLRVVIDFSLAGSVVREEPPWNG